MHLHQISHTHDSFGDVPADSALMLQDQGSIAACCAARRSCLHGQDGDGIMLACCACSGPPSGNKREKKKRLRLLGLI